MWLKEKLGEKYESFMAEQLEGKRIVDSYGIKYLSDIDLEVCNYVRNKLFYMDIGKINPGKEIDRFSLINICLKDIEKLGNDVCLDIEKMLFSTPIVSVPGDDVLQLATGISYENVDGKIKENSGMVTRFYVPFKLYEIAGCFFGHEQLHAMKDTNFREYINLKIVGEVIPIFYEFMIYSPEEAIKKEMLKARIGCIFDNAYEFMIFNNLLKAENLMVYTKDTEYYRKIQVYEYMRTIVGCYLNSFYYALILYNMYKENPQKILYLVSKVLKHEMITLEMLEQLGIYGDIRGEVFEKELQNIKKLVK